MRRQSFALAVACAIFQCCLATLASAQTATLDLRVIPRIGLFNALQYKGADTDPDPQQLRGAEKAGWAPLRKADYLALAKSRNAALAKLYLFGDWDLLTTDDAQHGYRSRRVQVTVAVNGGTAAATARDCVLRLRNPAGTAVQVSVPGQRADYALASPDCRFDPMPSVVSNERLDATVDLILDGRPAHLTGDVPEDFLIVSLGDSYAAGQGNPDVPCKSGWLFSPCAERAVWMDERCHRSAFAATIQAGLQMLRTENNIPTGRRGAVTIASLACSGATLDNGILGRYDGQINLTKFRELNADRGLVALGDNLEKNDKLPEQVVALRSFLGRQDAAFAKRTIDVLSVTIGGNDVGFAAALIDMVVRRKKGEALAEMASTLGSEVGKLRETGLPRLRDELARFRTVHGYDILQTLYTEYPDPTRVSANPDVFCAGVPVDGWLSDVARIAGYKLSAEETAVAYRVVVRGLNTLVTDASTAYGWRAVDGLMDNPGLLGRGWCAEAPGGPYAAKERWFRKADESLSTQGNPFGGMHPTWEMHDAIATRMLGLIASGLQPRLKAELGNKVLEKDAALVVSPPLAFRVRDGDTAASVRQVCYGEVCNPKGEFPLASDSTVGLVRVLHDPSARWFRHPVRPLLVDGLAPEIKACRILKANGSGMDCGSDAWIAEGDEFYAHFEDQGRAGLDKITWSTWARDTDTVPSAAPKEVDGPLRLGMEIPPGRHQLLLAAVDRVGNRTPPDDKRLSIPIRVDRVPPVFSSIAIHGHEFAGTPQPYYVPARIGDAVRIVVTGDDPVSGIRSLAVTVSPGTGDEARSEASNDAAATKCPALGSLDIQKTWARPFNVAIARTTGGAGAEVEARISALDCAQNAANASLRLLKLPLSAQRPQDAAWWKANGGALDQLSPKVALLAGQGALPPYDTGNARWPLAAAWLNLASGSLDPTASAPIRVTLPDCTAAAGTGTVFSLLKSTQACLDDPAGAASRDALLTAVAAALSEVYSR